MWPYVFAAAALKTVYDRFKEILKERDKKQNLETEKQIIQQELETKKQIAQIIAEMDKPKILFIYDTSWLMSPDHTEVNYGDNYNIEHIVLDSIKKEIMTHIHSDNEQKKINAGHARTIVSEIMAKDGYTEYKEADIIKMDIDQEILGPDSATDKLILSLANQCASTLSEGTKIDPTFAFILTHDGGIKTESVNLFKKHKKLIFTQSSITSFHKLLQETELLIHAKAEEELKKRGNT